jgi:hypothetical protein
MSEAVVRKIVNDLFVLRGRGLVLPRIIEAEPDVVVIERSKRIQLHASAGELDPFLEPALGVQDDGIPNESRRIARIEFDRSFQMPLGTGPIVIAGVK